MKRLFALLGVLIIGLNVWAQDELPKVGVHFRAGINASTFLIPNITFQNESYFGYASEQSLKIGAMAGFVVDVKLKNKCFLQTGLLYSWQRVGQMQTATFTDTSTKTGYSIASQNSYIMHRLKLPVMFQYHFSTNPNHFVVAAGVYVDAALGGSLTYDGSAILKPQGLSQQSYMMAGSFDPYKNDRKKIYYSLADDDYVSTYSLYDGPILNRVDFGTSLELGYMISKFYIGVHADFGLLNSMRKDFTQNIYVQRNMNIQLMLGYRISNY